MKDQAGAEGNVALRTVLKLLINSLYGKFVSKYFLSTTDVVPTKDLNEISEMFKLNSITALGKDLSIIRRDVMPLTGTDVNKDLMRLHFLRETKALAQKDLNVALGACVTSYGRVDLYRLMLEVLARKGVMMYTDTDRIFA